MPVVFNLLATQCPPPVAPGAFYAPALSTPHNAPYIPDGSTPDKILPWAKELANRIDEGQRYGHTGGYGVLEGLALLDLTANGIPITAGVAALDGLGFLLPLAGTDPRVTAGNPFGIGAFITVTDGAGIDNYLYAVSAFGTILPTKAVGTLTPPAGAAAYLGRAHMVSGVATLDGSGVLTRGSGGLWERRTADPGIPLDTPPPGIRFIQHSLTTDYLWDGTRYRPLFSLDMHGWMPGRPNGSELLVRWITPRPFTLLAGLPLSLGKAAVAATGSAVFSLQKGVPGVQFGTATFAPGATTPTFAAAADTAFSPGDLLSIVAPASSDATLTDISVVLVGSL